MTQSTFPFAALPPHVRGSATSAAAAESIAPHVQPMEAAVLAWIAGRGERGSTDNEGIAANVVHANGYRARRVSLARKKLIRQDGERNGSTIWRAT